MVARISHWKCPSAQAHRVRARVRKCRSRDKKRDRTSETSGKHRLCHRCRRRSDTCKKRGCKPFKYEICTEEYNAFKSTLVQLDSLLTARRHESDCIDVQVTCAVIKRCRAQGWHRAAVFVAILMGHYGNCITSFSVFLLPKTRKKCAECWVVL